MPSLLDYAQSVFPIRGARRSSQWPALRNSWLKDHAVCVGCGRTDELNVHHKLPVHVAPARELNKANLMTLCEHPTWNCHLIVGHCGNWSDYRRDPESAAALAMSALRTV